jgi:hypothetical protein
MFSLCILFHCVVLCIFVCKCVLYYCNRVSIQLQLTNISYHHNRYLDVLNCSRTCSDMVNNKTLVSMLACVKQKIHGMVANKRAGHFHKERMCM